MPLDKDGNIIIPVPRNPRQAAMHATDSGWKQLFWGEPAAYACTFCGRNDRFRLLVDTNPESGLIMIGCGCGRWTMPFELRMPQMRDEIAKKLGVYQPDKVLQQFDVDIPTKLAKEWGLD